jgi:hypothetical protein
MMDWVVSVVVGAGLLVLFSPLLMLALTVFVLAPLAHLARRPAMIGRSTFDCPLSKRRVSVEFLTSPDGTRPTDVRSCSMFADGRIRCAKGCCDLSETAWTPSPAVPRFALIAGDTTYR